MSPWDWQAAAACRLPEQIATRIAIDPKTGCWLWQGARNQDGYGIVTWERRLRRVHRVVYTLLVGPIPDGLLLDHVETRGCIHRHCCWPAHLEPVTRAENTRRGRSFSVINARKTHCKRGHEFTPENTRIYRGQRHCRTCQAIHDASRRKNPGLGPPGERTHCPKGHPYDEVNTRKTRNGRGRECKACHRIANREGERRRRARRLGLIGSEAAMLPVQDVTPVTVVPPYHPPLARPKPRRTKSPLPSLRERLLAKLKVDPSGCLLWQGSLNREGYGQISAGDTKHAMVHRVMWELFEGPIPAGLVLDHVRARGCYNRNCASIAHLEPVTPAENMRRVQWVRVERTTCINGHPFEPSNTYVNAKGFKVCRTCQRAARRRFDERAKAAKAVAA